MFARTDRLLLRPGWLEDAPALAAAIDEPVARNTARIPWPYGLADAEAFLSRPRQAHAPDCLIFLRGKGAPRLIGGVGLAPDADGHELGYWLARPYWGLGFATEAASALLRGARGSLKLRCIHSGHFADNPASGRVLAKLGFRPTGRVVRRESVARGGMVDCLLYSDAPASAPCEWPTLELEAA